MELEDELEEGRTLRDWFAGMAISGILANSDPNAQVAHMGSEDFADMAYEIAEALMSRREGKSVMPSLFPTEDVTSEDLHG